MSPLHAIDSIIAWVQTVRITNIFLPAPAGVAAPTPWSPIKKAIVATIFIFGATVVLTVLAYNTRHAYTALGFLGFLYGVALAYPVMKVLKKKIQAGVAAFLGGLTFDNIGSKETTLRTCVRSLAHWIATLVSDIQGYFKHPQMPIALQDWTYMDTAFVLCFWMMVITIVLVVFLEAYFSRNMVKLDVKSTPNAADVSADGVAVGNTPATLNLPVGGHSLSVAAPGRPVWAVDISASPESEIGIFVRL